MPLLPLLPVLSGKGKRKKQEGTRNGMARIKAF